MTLGWHITSIKAYSHNILVNRIKWTRKWQIGRNTLTIHLCMDMETCRHCSFSIVAEKRQSDIFRNRWDSNFARPASCKGLWQLISDLPSWSLHFIPKFSGCMSETYYFLYCLETQGLVNKFVSTIYFHPFSIILLSLNNENGWWVVETCKKTSR